MTLPDSAAYGTVTGQFYRGSAGVVEADVPTDLRVRFRPGLQAGVVRSNTAGALFAVDEVTATVDSSGQLRGVDGEAGVRLLASMSSDLTPSGWTWTVVISSPTLAAVTFAFVLEVAQTIDLATVLQVPPNPGATLDAWLQAASSAQAARDEALAAAASVAAGSAAAIQAAIDALVGAAPEALDTLQEIDATIAADEGSAAALAALVGTKAPRDSPTFTGTVAGITPGMVGADPAGAAAAAQAASLQKTANLSDLASPSAARTALGLGTAATHPTTDFDPAGAAAAVTKTSIGLANVDNTADTAKPVSTAQAAALALKADAASVAATSAALYGNPATERAARAAGRRLRAVSAGNRADTNPDVTVGAITAEASPSAIPSAARRGSWDWATMTVNHSLRILRGRMVQAGANGFIQTDTSVVTYAPGPEDDTAMRVDTGYNGAAIDVLPIASGSAVQYHYISVDGILVATITPAQIAAAGVPSGYAFRVPLTFATARPRRITWEVQDDTARFAGVDTEPANDIYYPAAALKGPRVLVAGDSFTEGTGTSDGGTNYVTWLGRHMGWDDVWRSGTGGTGYLTPGPRTALVDRYASDIVGQAANIAIIPMGMNDRAAYIADPASVITAATTVWDGITAGLPTAELVVIGPWPESETGATPEMTALDADLHAAAVARSLRYISPIADGWTFTRSAADGTHPDDAGHEYLGWRIAGYLAVPTLEHTA